MITIKVNDRSVLDALAKLTRGLTDMTPAMADIAQALASESERQFASQSGPLGAWPGLADSTEKARAKTGTWPGRMLQVSAGGLAPSVQTAHGAIFASISSNKPYSAIHMFGGQAGRGGNATIPARPYLPFNPQTKEISDPANETILEILSSYLNRLTD